MSEDQNAAPAAAERTLSVAAPPFLRAAAVYLLAFVVAYRPMCCGVTAELASVVVFTMLLVACGFAWVCEGALRGKLRWRAGVPTLLCMVFLVWHAITGLRGHNHFAAAQVWLLLASYALTGFLLLQLAGSRSVRTFLLSCLLATVATLAAFALVHLLVYMPALRRWFEQDPNYFRSVFEVQEGMLRDLQIRLGGSRALGNFITSNQLANFMVLGLFPLVGVLVASWSGSRRERARLLVIAAACLLVLIALYQSGSKGGLAAFAFGGAVLLLGSARKVVKQHFWKFLGGGVVLALLFVFLVLVPKWQFFRASLGVRIDYWRTSAVMIRAHPIAGIGPGGWKEYYTMLKAPQFEETKLAHNAYLQVWSESGTVGLLLFLALGAWALGPVLWRLVLSDEHAEANEEKDAMQPRWGLALGGAALLIDYVFIGTFKPPRVGTSGLFDVMPWLAYLILFGVWAVTFRCASTGLSRLAKDSSGRAGSFVLWGLVAGLGAFLLHSGAEFTFRVPALGATGVVVAVLLILGAGRSRDRETPLSSAAATILVLAAFAVTLPWAVLDVPRALDYSLAKNQAFALKGEMAGRDAETGLPARLTPEEALAKRQELVEAYEVAVGLRVKAGDGAPRLERLRLVPGRWDDDCWHDLAVHQFVLAQELRQAGPMRYPSQVSPAELVARSESALRQAIELNRLRAKHHAALGRLMLQTGRGEAALPHFARAVELHPTLPGARVEFAEAAERFEGLSDRVCDAYAKALELSPRQYHERNRLAEPRRALIEQKVRACKERRGEK